MPDALSKTIPIWCSVLNRFLFPDDVKCHDLYTPPQVVSQSEHAQISSLLPDFSRALEELNIPLEDLKRKITKPLRPIWSTPESDLTPTTTIFKDFHPVICCTVSRRVTGGEMSEGGYIQGAGDDTENWAHGLTPPVYWAHKNLLLSTSETELPELIKELVRQAASVGPLNNRIRCVKPTTCLFIAPTSEVLAPSVPNDNKHTIVLMPKITEESTWQTSKNRLDIGLGPHKIGSRNLRTALPAITNFVEEVFLTVPESKHTKDILIACDSGMDLSIGAALAILCLFFSDEGTVLPDGRRQAPIDKSFIRSRLGWISTTMPDANPSRATLQSVNSVLMDRK